MKKILILLIAVITIGITQSFSQTVYVTNTGHKYHSAGCRYLKSSSNAIELSKAKERYTACSVCKPADKEIKSASPTQNNVVPQTQDNSNNKSSGSGQCNATTKAGSRCKRMTYSSNGKCWQHGGN